MADNNHSPGLVFRKLDLHLHTPASKCFADRNVSPENVVERALETGLDGIAVTDHNSGAWIDKVKVAAKGRLVVFPGVEITCQGGEKGLHIIALFDPSVGTAEVESLLSGLGLQPKDYGQTETIVTMTPQKVCEEIVRRHGLAVLAHANSTNGVLCDMQGQQRIDLINHTGVAGVEGTDFTDDKKRKDKKRVVDLLSGDDNDFRKHAVYQASDNPTGSGDGKHGLQGIGSRCSYFKMDRINIESLGQCFYDPDVRIRQDFELAPKTFPHIENVRITGGFLDGATATFHNGLNSVLGGKGAGKSLLVEFIRFALDQPPENSELLIDHQSKLSERLGEFGTVEIDVVTDTGTARTVKRVLQPELESPYEDDAHANIARDFPVLFMSQNEILKIAESPSDQIHFIDRFFDFRHYTGAVVQHEHDLARLDKEYADCLRSRSDAEVLDKSIQGFVAELGKLDAGLKNPVFEQFQALETKDSTFREQLAVLANLRQAVGELQRQVNQFQQPSLPEALTRDPALQRTHKLISRAKALTAAKLDSLAAELQVEKDVASAEYSSWQPTFNLGKQGYLTAVQKEGGDYRNLAARRGKVVQELETLKRRHELTKQRADRIRSVADARNVKLQDLQGVYQAYSQERRTKCEKLQAQSLGRLQITIREASDHDIFRARLASLKKGSYVRNATLNTLCAHVDPSQFVRGIIEYSVKRDSTGLTKMAQSAGLEPDQVKALADFLIENLAYEELLQLQYKVMPQDKPEIKYNVGDKVFMPLEKVSIGQKCAAMLIMALSDGAMPVVIDQPEDSLDIRSVWEDICLKIRGGKEQRQFIFTTHNASLAVASDSDKFVILQGEATQGRVLFSGSMDHSPISDEVLTYLEGGPTTYEMKYVKFDAKRRLDELHRRPKKRK